MLSIHSWCLVFPALLPAAAILAWRKRRDPDTLFLLAWIGIFFAGALVIFFAGSARYLLPMAAPVALLASRLARRWLAPGFAAPDGARPRARHRQLPALGRLPPLRRRAARPVAPDIASGWMTIGACATTWKRDGALPARKGQRVRPGDIVVTSELGHNVEFTAPLSRRRRRR